MSNARHVLGCRGQVLVSVLVAATAGVSANGAVTILGGQYQQDDPLTEFQCLWYDANYPTSCQNLDAPFTGANVHVYVRNDGASSVTINDVTLAGFNLATVIKLNANNHDARSIYYYWDNPPQAILDAGEPVWYKADPATIPAGGVAQVVVRLRMIPATATLSLGVVTSGGTVNTTVPVDANAAQLASVGFSEDRKKVYLHWRRSGGAAPTAIKMDGVDVTANATTVGDPNVNYGATVLTFSTALANMSYHVYQGIYSDGKTATASLRTWVNKFIHGTYNTFDLDTNYTIADWIAESSDHGINNCQVSVGNVAGYMSTAAGAADCLARGYGYTSGDKTKFDSRGNGPDMFFINDEIDAEDANMERTFCGTGLKLPCDRSSMGVLAMRSIEEGEALRDLRPLTPTSINMDGTHKPENYYSYGQAVDILQADPYYQRRLQDVYWRDQNVIPLYQKATYIYAVSKAVARAAEPNPSNIILYSCSWKCMNENACDAQYLDQVWPYPTPQAKRIEVYYALAAGTKGLCYWWLNSGGWPAHGLADQSSQAARNLWKEVGLYGNEIKTIAPLLVTSHPIDMTLQGSSDVWAKALASGTDTMILLVVNDDYYNDFGGCHYTPKPNATLTATLPSWMQSSLTAFEITPGGLSTVTTQLNGSQLQLTLGTLNLTRMIVVTTNPLLRETIQLRYEQKVRPGVCTFASEYCLPQNNPASITQHPLNQTVVPGGSTSFKVFAAGNTALSYQWQKNNLNLSNGGHYSGCTTPLLTVSSANSNDAANYRCVVTNPYGTATSNAASLTLGAPSGPSVTQHPSDQSVDLGDTATFTVTATGTGPLSYQWQKNQANLANGGHYSGVTTTTLTITGADIGDEASYRCVVSDPYGSDTSDEATLTVNTCPSFTSLQNGDFENWPSGLVAPNWTGAYSETVANQFVRSTTIVRPGGSTLSQGVKARDATGAWAQVYQGFDTNVGDALTILAYAYPTAVPAGANPQVGVNTSSARPSSWLYTLSSFTKNTWCTIGPLAYNATATTTYLFLDVKRVGAVDTTTYWDDISVYHAHVPPAPTVGNPTSSTLAVNIDPGCNSTNSNAEYAISIGGGAYTLGANWVLANGSVGAVAAWQTDAAWANKTVTGLATNTTYTFEVKARYSSTYTQETSRGAGASGTTGISCTPPAAPTGALANPSTLCGGSSSVLSATAGSGGDTVDWFTGGCGTTLVPGGSSPSVSPGVTTTYYARTKHSPSGCTSTSCVTATITVNAHASADFDGDCDVDASDASLLIACMLGPHTPQLDPACQSTDLDGDSDVDQADFGSLQRCYSGSGFPADLNCANPPGP